MKCAFCDATLKQISYQDLQVDMCPRCGGTWFDEGEMPEFIRKILHDQPDIPNAKIELNNKPVNLREISESVKTCPKCNKSLEKINYLYSSNIILDKCNNCNGLWVDSGEIRKLAIYMKGNPNLDALGETVLLESRQRQQLDDLANVADSFSRRPHLMVLFLPRMIFPLRDDIETKIMPFVTLGIIAINIIVYLMQLFYVQDIPTFLKAYGLVPSVLFSSGPLPFITSMFIHSGIIHLTGNMFFLWIFGDNVEEQLGHLAFLCFFIICGAGAGFFHTILNQSSSIPIIGASGAVAGTMGAYFRFYPHAKIKTLIIHRLVDVPAFLFLGVWIALQILYSSLYASINIQPTVGYSAHAGGFIIGLSLAWLLGKKQPDLRKD